ncbi:MAG: WYL domain-containing protein [Clostridia bacterium]|nr:WYL domain-containing protein [Clostridia bacterium]
MREFYVYGFKSRADYDKKSARSYDDEKRRMESILGDYMSFVRTPEGKNVFLSIDSRTSVHNPFYKALKAKSFTDGDITLHFIIFDILHSPDVEFTLAEIMEIIDEKYLSGFEAPMMFDESTIRKKLKEYCSEGLIITSKQGRKVTYSRSEHIDTVDIKDALDYFSEIAPCGAVGSFLLDKEEKTDSSFTFKHHYITSAMDSDVLACLFDAMRQKRAITANNLNRKHDEPRLAEIVPLRIFISVQNGRQYLLAYQTQFSCITSYRVDYLSNVKPLDVCDNFDDLRARLDDMQTKMWGVNTRQNAYKQEHLEHVEFIINVADNEEYIVRRLYREKRIGNVEKLDDHTYRFSADVYDTTELVPWIRTFICRITQMDFSNRTAENRFKGDLKRMYEIYGIGKEVSE